jgi:hypothetical protein
MGYIRSHSKYKDTQGYGGRSASAPNDAAHTSNKGSDWTPPQGIVRPSRPSGSGKIVVNIQHNLGPHAERTIENTLRYGG